MDMTVLLVSHSMEDMANYVQRIVVLNHGTLMLDGTPSEVFSHVQEAGTGVIGGPAGDLSDERSGKSRISCGYDSDNDRGSKERDYKVMLKVLHLDNIIRRNQSFTGWIPG